MTYPPDAVTTAARVRTEWSRQKIRSARKADLVALLLRHEVPVQEKGGGNFELLEHPGLIAKANYWRWPERDWQGNTIDFFVRVKGRTFAQAMDIIAEGE
jgi:hypothetical protein